MVKEAKINNKSVLEKLQERCSSNIEYFNIFSANEEDAEILECEIGDAIVEYYNIEEEYTYMEVL